MNGFTSNINTVFPGFSVEAKTNRSVKSRRASPAGNLSIAALKWFDIWLLSRRRQRAAAGGAAREPQRVKGCARRPEPPQQAGHHVTFTSPFMPAAAWPGTVQRYS